MADATLPDNAPAGTPVAAVSVGMSDGSTFTGTLDLESEGMATVVGMQVQLARMLTSDDGGLHTWTLTATQDLSSISLDAEIEIIPVPVAVLFDPSEVSLPDDTEAGFHIAEITVEMSDGSEFTGTLTASPSTIVTMVGTSLRTARMLTPNDVGSHTWTVTTQSYTLAIGSVEAEVTRH